MPDRLLTCIVCEDAMNQSTRQPVSLQCGHTFCRQCLVRIRNEERLLRCPTCRQCHQGQRPEQLPPNFALLSMMEPDESNSNENHSANEVPPAADSGNISQSEASPASGSPEGNGSGNSNGNQSSKILKGVGIAAGAIAGGVAVVAAAPVVLTAAGFTSAGIAAGSWAASMMSAAAIANGGGVAAGGIVATLQAAGAAGIGATTAAGLGAGGAAAGGGITYGISRLFGRSNNSNGGTNASAGNDDDSGNDGGPNGGSGKKGSSQSNISQEGKDDSDKDNTNNNKDEKDDDSEKSDDEKEDSSDAEDSEYGRSKSTDINAVCASTTEQNGRRDEQSKPLMTASDKQENVNNSSNESEEFLNARKLIGDAIQKNLIDFADEE